MTTEESSNSGGWVFSASLSLFLFLIYIINFSLFFDTDTIPSAILPVAMIRGDGPFLDRFAEFLPKSPIPGEQLPYIVTEARGHIVSRYPIGPAILAMPIVVPQVMMLDRFRPGWDRDGRQFLGWCLLMAKVSSAAMTAAASIAVLHLLRGVGLARVALPTTMAAALGTSLWTIASQSLWQHGPAALALTLTMILMLPQPPSRIRLVLAGGTTAALVSCRMTDLVFAGATFFYIARHRRCGLAWFLIMPIVIGGLLITYNTRYFGNVTGGLAQLETLHPQMHGVAGPWTGNLLEGAAGILFSPSRGLFVFSPWIALALAALPAFAPRLRPWPHVRYLLWSLIPFSLLLSKYSVWWGGHCFGPRYWTDAVPLFAILLGFALDWVRTRSRSALFVLATSIVFSVAVQALGAFRYTRSWDRLPVDIDQHHERLWDWRDSVLIRCLNE